MTGSGNVTLPSSKNTFSRHSSDPDCRDLYQLTCLPDNSPAAIIREAEVNRFVPVKTVTNVPGFSVASKSGGAPPHSKTQAKLPCLNRGHVLECGSVLPLLSALVGLRSKTSLNRYSDVEMNRGAEALSD